MLTIPLRTVSNTLRNTDTPTPPRRRHDHGSRTATKARQRNEVDSVIDLDARERFAEVLANE